MMNSTRQDYKSIIIKSNNERLIEEVTRISLDYILYIIEVSDEAKEVKHKKKETHIKKREIGL